MSQDKVELPIILETWIARDTIHTTEQFPSSLSQLEAVRHFVQKCCEPAPGNIMKLIEELQLAINEAFCNIVIHSYLEKDTHTISIVIYLLEKGILIQLSDQGVEFDPKNIPTPHFTGKEESGFGWYIINTIADRLVYLPKSQKEGWNHLRIFKHYCQ